MERLVREFALVADFRWPERDHSQIVMKGLHQGSRGEIIVYSDIVFCLLKYT